MIDPAGFDDLYRGDPDPFGVAERWYERRKQSLLLACLAHEHYALAWDTAAGTGHLAQALLTTGRCAQVLATDASVKAVQLLTARLTGHPGARVAPSALPDVPADALAAELTIVAEVLYYLPRAERARASARLAEQHGELVAVHWRHHPHDAALSGAQVTEELGAALEINGWRRLVHHDDPDFVLASWSRAGEPR